jgi:hypothetical protein
MITQNPSATFYQCLNLHYHQSLTKIKLHNCLFLKIKKDKFQVVTPIQMLASIIAGFFEC